MLERVEDLWAELARDFRCNVIYEKTRPLRLHRAFKSDVQLVQMGELQRPVRASSGAKGLLAGSSPRKRAACLHFSASARMPNYAATFASQRSSVEAHTRSKTSCRSAHNFGNTMQSPAARSEASRFPKSVPFHICSEGISCSRRFFFMSLRRQCAAGPIVRCQKDQHREKTHWTSFQERKLLVAIVPMRRSLSNT